MRDESISSFASVAITEQPTLGKSNLVINRGKAFDIKVSWHVFGNLVPLWLTALQVSSPNWVVTAYAESQGPGDEISLGSVLVPVGGPIFSLDEAYSATLTVPANTLSGGEPRRSVAVGHHKIIVTAFLDSNSARWATT